MGFGKRGFVCGGMPDLLGRYAIPLVTAAALWMIVGWQVPPPGESKAEG